MTDEREKNAEVGELISVLFMVLLFFAVLAGREIGDIYSSFNEVSQLSFVFQLGEEEIAGYIRDVLKGTPSELGVGMALTLPSARNVEGVVTQLPDYVRRWFISVTLSPIVVNQPEVSDVEITLLVEGEAIQTRRFSFRRERVPYLVLLDRSVTFIIDDVDRFREAVMEASERYGGEVEMTFNGRALSHLLFLESWLPFSTTRYPLVKVPHLDYVSSRWTDLDGQPVSRLRAGETAIIQFKTSNPTRVHSIHENVTATVYMESSGEQVYRAWKVTPVAPSSTATYFFQFTPEAPGVYYYSLEAADGFKLAADASPRLLVEGS